MRRFVAYILASITLFLGIGIAFKPIVTSINADLDFRDGREITFRLSDRDDENDIKPEDEAPEYYADVIESRLVSYGIDNYTIRTSGDDTVKVTLTTSNTDECARIAKLLCVNPEIELCNLGKEGSEEEKVDEHPVNDDIEGKYSWHDSKAYLTYDGASTVVVMPIPSEMQQTCEEMFELAKKYEGGGDDPEPSNDDPEPAKQSIILWMDRREGDEYANKVNPNIAKRIIYDQFNTSNFYYGDNKEAFKITFTPTGADLNSITTSYNEARLMMCMLNASETKFDCTDIHTEIIPANVENLLIYGKDVNIKMSATLVSIIIAFVVISLILLLYFRLGAIAIIATTSTEAFLTLTFFTQFGAIFNIAALVGLLVVTLSSLVSSLAYNANLREELYKGRNLKKANYEASKKTTLITVDVSILLFIAGTVLYFLGGPMISSVGVMLTIGSVLNILINTFILKGMMWLLTNNTVFQDKKYYSYFKVDNKRVPDLSLEEKPNYFGPYANKDFTKKKKLSGIISGVLLLASVVGLIAFGATGKLFNSSAYYSPYNEATFSIESDTEGGSHPTIDEVETKLKQIYVNKSTQLVYKDVTYYEYSYVKSEDGDKYETAYLQNYRFLVGNADMTSEIYYVKEGEGFSTGMELKDAINEVMEEFNLNIEETRVYTNNIYNIPNDAGIVVASGFITIFAFSVYMLIRRFRASRILTVFATSTVGGAFALGFISLTRVVATPVLSLTIIATMLLTTMMGLFILHKDKELIKDERLKDLATRKAVLKKANALALVPMIVFSIIAIYSAINFFGLGHKAYLALFFSLALGLLMNAVLILTWFLPANNYLDEQFSRVNLPKIKLRKKEKIKEKSNTPEEAIFIGIND